MFSAKGEEMTTSEKIVWILKRLGEPPFEMTASELASEMLLERSGVYKILQTLTDSGILIKSEHTKRYSVGPAIYRLGVLYSERKGIWELAEPILKNISAVTEQTVSIGILEGTQPILAYRIESPHEIRLANRIGSKYPFYAGAIGKLLTAYLPADDLLKVLDQDKMIARASQTITDKEALTEEYRKIRALGYAHSDEENTPGAFGISAPLFDKYGNVRSCICIAGKKKHFSEKRIRTWTKLLLSSAEELSYRMGYREK